MDSSKQHRGVKFPSMADIEEPGAGIPHQQTTILEPILTEVTAPRRSHRHHSAPKNRLPSSSDQLKGNDDDNPDAEDSEATSVKADDECDTLNDETLNSDARDQELEAKFLNSMETLAPFKLKWVYGRSSNVNVINLTGLYKNHIAYTSSNTVIIYDYVGNVQQCLQGHKNVITAFAMDSNCRFFASVDAGYKSLIIIWDAITGKALKFFPEPHEGKGCVTVTFTGTDFIVATIGSEDPGKQTICLWDFDSTQQRKTAIVTGNLPHCQDLFRELSFDQTNPDFFAATGDNSVIFCTWMKPKDKDDKDSKGSIFCYKPKARKGVMSKYKKFCHSLWMKEGKWLATSTMSGLLCIWGPPTILGLEDPPDVRKNIRELARFYRLSDDGITYFTLYKSYIVIGDEKGIIRFYDQDMKLLRWTKNFYVKSIHCIHFNLTDELPNFKRHLRHKFDRETQEYLRTEGESRVKDYSLGGTKDRVLSMTTLNRPPLPSADFIYTVDGGDVFYYHFNQSKVDKLVHGSPGKFVTCDVCPGSNNVIFSTRKGEIQVFDFNTHKLIFSDQIFSGTHRVNTMKFHPTGFFITFGLIDGHLTFRRNFSWKTLIPPMNVTSSPILRIIFSDDGLLMSYFTHNRSLVLLRYTPKGKSWVYLGRCRPHHLDICDIQFLYDPPTQNNRLFSLGLDRYLVEYDVANCNPGDPRGLRALKIMRLEETCQPTAMVFDGPTEYGEDCITFSNTLNKLRVFHYKDERVKTTVSGPVFGREHSINRMITYPAKMAGNRFKKFIIFVRGNKLGIIDTPVDGNPHKYMAVFTHPGPIVDVSVVADKHQIFTVGHKDSAALQWETSMRSVESTVMMGGAGIVPFYNVLRRNWGDACQDIVKEIDLIFFFLNLKRVDTQTDIFNITRTIRICEIPTVCRACGFFPSEYELDLFMDEARRIKIKHLKYTDDASTELSFEDFIKLFSNHYYRISEQEVEDAFKHLGFDDKNEISVCQSNLVNLLTTEGEPLKPADLPLYFEALYMDEPVSVLSTIKLDCKVAKESSGNDLESAELPGEGKAPRADKQTTNVKDVRDDGETSSSSSTHTADDDSLGLVGSNGSSDGGLVGEEEDEDDEEDSIDDPYGGIVI